MTGVERVVVRRECAADAAGIRAVHVNAFETDAEATLVDRLRECGEIIASFVAVVDDRVVGHVAFRPVRVFDSDDEVVNANGAGLAPVAVLPAFQRSGIGGRLIRAGIEACRERGIDWLVVLGDPAYYPRFGFAKASQFGLDNEYDVDEPFMAMTLREDVQLPRGLVRYSSVFAEIDV